MESVILTIHLLLAAALIVVVLLQRSEGGGLGIGGGGVMSGRAAATALSKVTWMLGIAFVITSLTLTVIAARTDGGGSVLDRLGIEAPAPDAAPGLGGSDDLLPPTESLAPAVPPAGTPSPAVPPAGDAPATPPPVE
jgi:preprotein translocase subunit SecG